MKTQELLEATAKPVDDRRVGPAARIKRIIKQLTDGKRLQFEITQTQSTLRKNGDVIVNIEVSGVRRTYDIASMHSDPEIQARLAARLADRKLKLKDADVEKKEFMVALVKRAKEELGGLREIGYDDGSEGRAYKYVPTDEFDIEKLIKSWASHVRLKFAFGSEVHGSAFDMKTEVPRVMDELVKLMKKDPELKQLGFTINSEHISIIPPGIRVSGPKRSRYGDVYYDYYDEDDNPIELDEVRVAYGMKHWAGHKKKIKRLFAEIETPIRLVLSGVNRLSGRMTISFQKPRAVDLHKE